MILVTGATSAVGTAVIEELLARKIPVRAFVHQPAAAERLEARAKAWQDAAVLTMVLRP